MLIDASKIVQSKYRTGDVSKNSMYDLYDAFLRPLKVLTYARSCRSRKNNMHTFLHKFTGYRLNWHWSVNRSTNESKKIITCNKREFRAIQKQYYFHSVSCAISYSIFSCLARATLEWWLRYQRGLLFIAMSRKYLTSLRLNRFK